MVLCDECGKEYPYEPDEVLRLELELPGSFKPHPLFQSPKRAGLSSPPNSPIGPNSLAGWPDGEKRESRCCFFSIGEPDAQSG